MRIASVLLLTAVQQGTFSRYAPGVMEGMLYRRQTRPDIPAVNPVLLRHSLIDGYIAVESCADFERVVKARPVGGSWELLLVVDCSGHTETTTWMRDNRILGEVDYPTAQRWGHLPSNPRGYMQYYVPPGAY